MEEQRARPRIGVDTWVAEVETRVEDGLVRRLEQRWRRLHPAGRLGLLVVPAAFVPVMSDSDYVVRVGVDTLLFALLALGLNVVVGYAGLLDLGYIAFYGFGAYTYALLASPHFGVHWPAEATMPLVMAATALLGLLLGLPSRRLLGDYLAIVTLFFGQAFVTFVINADQFDFPFVGHPVNFTGGVNGVPNVDPLDLFGLEIHSIQGYFWLALAVFVLVMTALHFLSESRTGRAWKALREDPLAAELMSMPVNRLKLLAFAFGAAIAGLTGTIHAAVLTGVFPTNFDVSLLITVYAMVILGGTGSLAGVVVGAITINVLLEVLRSPGQARWVFYAVILGALLARTRPWRKLALVLGGAVGFGFAVHAIASAAWPAGTEGAVSGGGFLRAPLEQWVLLPADPGNLGKYAYVALIAAVIALARTRGWARLAGAVPTLYLAALVWENVLVQQPSVTRILMLGAILVALMNSRPQGLMGTARVEIG